MSDPSDVVRRILRRILVGLSITIVILTVLALVVTPREGRPWQRTVSIAAAAGVALLLVGAVLYSTRGPRPPRDSDRLV